MVVLVLSGVVLAVVGVGALLWSAVTGPPFWRPPAVAPLALDATFSAAVVLADGDG